MMKFLLRVMAFLLAAAVTLTASWWILSHTLGSATYLESRADNSQAYQKIAGLLPDAPNAQILRGQVEEFLPKLITSVTGSDTAAPLVLPGTADPITPVAPGSPLAGLLQASGQISWLGPTAIVVMIILILVIARASRWKVLSLAFLDVAIGLALTAGILWLAPGFVMQNFVTAGLTVLKSALEPFIISLLHDIAWQFIIAALGALALSIILRIISTLLHLKNRFIKPRAPKEPKLDPNSFPPPPGRLQN